MEKTSMKSVKLALIATLLAAAPAVAYAQDVGATVYGNDGNPIGTVESVANGIVTIDTGKHKAPIPADLIGTGETGPSINATKEQIDGMMDAQVAEANAKRDAALVEGAAVVSADGMPAGKVYTIDAEDTVIVQNDGGIVTLTRESFAVSPEGALMALYSAQQLTANTVAVPEGAEILTPAQARAKQAEMASSGDGEGASGASM
ncbi:hypothetical protein I603_0872 [Erythrobacter dokdonensis DSW-74]|uniref:PRC-barrel domain-containing protein n=2 Tax=Erythrobacter TaxID=1041 RepID=A0A1A7BG14_9SPHN|nr:hypothetical protein I603_0872 [Erythrobacter dokdonensis DSW-74]